ncbi:PREDICTED: peroxisomal membrane protein PEX14-like isoform X2 [Lupinus angustifolius]|uniref:peroxisomal membrane protein PEX14-like isoform X2 n=1 Tax=Lupinus angustifolius TaxID=3871 RepID=UPI00092E7534|nr:PREDICTED: peroxisomal membrane protein PEX14-like isoform X2 [Lupinus angustifolius]
MATQSPPPSTASDDNNGAETVQPTNVDQQNAKEDPAKQTSTTSVFVNSQPLREEQVQNAVKFLSHPKVKGSPVIYRRSFLEKKGLTKEEIDEAFQRVPDSPPSVQTAGINQVLTDEQLKTSLNIPQQTLQPGLPASTGVNTSSQTLSRSRFHWYHALIAVGVLAASGAGTAIIIKNSILPRLKSWVRKVVLEEDDKQLKKTDKKLTLAEETAQAAKSAAVAAADVARASQEMLASTVEERKYFVEIVGLLGNQIQEMKLMTNAIRRLEGQEDLRVTQTSSKQFITNGKAAYDLHSVRSLSPPASIEPSNGLHPKSYMEIMAMVQRGEKPSNIRDINDLPPNPIQQPSNPRLLPRSKPWEVSQVQNTSTQVLQSQVNGEGLNIKVQDTTQIINGDDPVPWWQRKNVRIQEIDSKNEYNRAPYAATSSQQPVQRVWVPPQPPPIAMPEAAEAIRRPKPVVQEEQASDNQSVAQSSEVSDEVNRISKPSESEGAVEGSTISSLLNSGEIQEDREVTPAE